MPKVFNKSLSETNQEENIFSITDFVSNQLMPELTFPESLDAKSYPTKREIEDLATQLLTKLANSKKLSFGNALEVAPAFGKVFIKFFKNIIKEGNEKINQIRELLQAEDFNSEIFDEQQEGIIFWLNRFHQNDSELEQKANTRSVVDILNKQGYLEASQPFFSNDLKIALEGYHGQHNVVTVKTDVSLYVENAPDIPELKKLIDNEKKLANSQNQERKILIPTNNGTFHFVCLDIAIKPSGK